ncbi:MAG: DNA repair protein RadC [Holosporales bacterium]|nr:DNA repair protein RadC [Holosporales bacterium]
MSETTSSALRIQKDGDTPQRGHRKRVFQKLTKHGYTSFLDYEIVEMMLFLIFKRKDTKPLAKILIEKFGTIDKILEAPYESLMNIPGIGENAVNTFKVIDAIVKSSLQSRIIKKSVIECFDDVLKYCKVNMKNLTSEEFRIILLNGINEIICDEIVQKGSIDSVDVSPREILKLCIEKGAKGFILVHNHPSGDPTPSVNDVYTTKRIQEAANVFNITLYDHIIIGMDKYVSFRNLKIIKE